MLQAKQHQMVQPEGVDVTTHTRPTADTLPWRASRNVVHVGPTVQVALRNTFFPNGSQHFQDAGVVPMSSCCTWTSVSDVPRETSRQGFASAEPVCMLTARCLSRCLALILPQDVHVRCTLHGSRRDLRLVVQGADIQHLGTENNRSTGHGRACPVDLLVAKGCRCAHVSSVLKVYLSGSHPAISLLFFSADAVRTSAPSPRVVA